VPVPKVTKQRKGAQHWEDDLWKPFPAKCKIATMPKNLREFFVMIGFLCIALKNTTLGSSPG
jgi:hypothetical protein